MDRLQKILDGPGSEYARVALARRAKFKVIDIAARLGRSKQWVSHLSRNRPRKRKTGVPFPDVPDSAIRAAYAERATATHVGERTGMSANSASARLKKLGLSVRVGAEPTLSPVDRVFRLAAKLSDKERKELIRRIRADASRT